ncbi:Atrazine chlorohydrolase [Neomoorella glycerini]|uniref:Atrazine chlorohydrolase n=1 Tax=Neomoorella glycerini TaxID=55779 RepID=A0A6I5ZSQ2_9FIRM|nr:amidohydrolase [Moorella glycerini]QGP92625.1 Atrazine chlorohydrolase [Moorella glycerini]
MPQILIKNGYVVSMNPLRQVFAGGDVLVEGDKIVAAGTVPAELIKHDAEVVDASGKIVMPGLVNTHVHLSQQLGRGLGDDVDLLTWLHERIWPYESSMDLEDSYISSLACCLELIHSGVTTFAEPGGQEVDGMGRAVEEIGLRGILARSTMDCGEGLPAKWRESTDYALRKQEEHIRRWHGQANGRIKVWFGLRTIFNNSDELIKRTKDLADKYGVGIHMHVAEIDEEVRFAKATRGHTTVEHLAQLGVLDANFLAVHTVWLTEKEIDLFLLHDVKVSHNPAAAMRVLGFARVPEMIAKGITVSIGTDGAPSNNRMDMMDEMYLATLIHKGRNLNPKILPAEKVLEMATIDGARCLLWDDAIGSLEPGKKADLIIINPRSAGSLPLHDPIANLVYAMHASNVEASMCDGRWLMRDKKILTVNEEEILDRVQARAAALVKKAGIVLPDRFPVVKVR